MVSLFAWIVWALLVGFAGTNRRGGFGRAFMLSLFLGPLVAIIFTVYSAQMDPPGCPHCGNPFHEAEFCGVCGLNADGVPRKPLK